jgi:hypothetical protein
VPWLDPPARRLQIQAMSTVLQRPIHVWQAQGPVVTTGDRYAPPVLHLSYVLCPAHARPPVRLSPTRTGHNSYHRHMYRLGEHYNSLHAAAATLTPSD